MERVQPKLYIHVTEKANVKSILKHGLIPNYANDGNGRYDDTRWITLPGIYATNSASLITKIINGMNGDIAFVILAVSPPSTLPDEDALELLMTKCYNTVLDNYGIDGSFAERPIEYFDSREEAPDFELHPDDLQDENDLWQKVLDEFHIQATKNPNVIKDQKLLDELLWYWRAHHIEDYGESEIDPLEWVDVKDALVRKYRDIVVGDFQKHVSVRITNPVTFKGRNRIVAIVDDDYISYDQTLYGVVPPEIEPLVRRAL